MIDEQAYPIFQSSIYMPLITICLSENKNKYVDHNDLCIALGISKANLSNIIKRIEKYKLFACEKIGRNKYYYLTPSGNDYYSYLTNKENKKYYRLVKEKLKKLKKHK